MWLTCCTVHPLMFCDSCNPMTDFLPAWSLFVFSFRILILLPYALNLGKTVGAVNRLARGYLITYTVFFPAVLILFLSSLDVNATHSHFPPSLTRHLSAPFSVSSGLRGKYFKSKSPTIHGSFFHFQQAISVFCNRHPLH